MADGRNHELWSLRSALALAFVLGSGAGCLRVDPYGCQQSGECLNDGVQGSCRFDLNTCSYPAPECASGEKDGAGDCLPPGGTTTQTETSTTGTETQTTTTVDPVTSTTDPSTSTDPTTATDTTGPQLPCDGAIDNLTSLGIVGASSVFMNFDPIYSVDNQVSTSWFSTGPEGVNESSLFWWDLGAPRCIARINFVGNGDHENVGFQTDFGFGEVTFKIYDEMDQVVFEDMRGLAGTPDPDTMVDTPGVMGVRVELELFDHEDLGCGGFSELQVLGK